MGGIFDLGTGVDDRGLAGESVDANRERPWSKSMGKNKDRRSNYRDRRFDCTAARPVSGTAFVLAIGYRDLDFGCSLPPPRKI